MNGIPSTFAEMVEFVWIESTESMMNEQMISTRWWKGSLRLLLMALTVLAASLTSKPASAGPQAQVGPYKVEVATDPAVIAVGNAKLLMRVTDASGKPVEGATVSALVKMPTMDMGEVERPATPVSGQPGVYEAPAAFAMAGGYDATLKITGSQGAATGKLSLQTGQDTGGLSTTGGSTPGGAGAAARFFPWVLGLLAAGFIAFRMKVTGQHPNWRSALHWQFGAGMGVLIAIVILSNYAIAHWRRPGSMTPIEAQAMEMNTPAPPGTAPVELASVTDGTVDSTVRYTGQAVGNVEQEVYPRVRGWITWMPFYVGDHVRKGQLLARLDTSEIQPQIAEKQAMANIAKQGTTVAQTEFRQALEMLSQARSEVSGKAAALRDAQAGIASAQAERSQAEAELASVQTMIANAEAELDAAKAQNEYAQAQAQRTKNLQKSGAASGEEAQKDASMAADAGAKVRQAQAALVQAKAEVRAKQSAIRKADAMLTGSQAKLAQMTADLESARAGVRVAQAAADAARARIGQAASGVAQARASEAQSTTQRGYSEIRSEVDGVVTQRIISPGVLVNPGQAILKVAQITPIRLQANVAAADLEKVRVGNFVTITSQNGTGNAVNAKVTSVTPSLDPTSRTGVVEAVIPNKDGRFLPGQYLVMDIGLGQKRNALRVPSQAIQWRTTASGGILTTQSKTYVWVAEETGSSQYTVHPVPVAVGMSNSSSTQILSGLKPGQKVVVAGYQNLSDGDAVTPAGGSGTPLHAVNAVSAAAPAASDGMAGM